MDRRKFLKASGLAISGMARAALPGGVALVINPSDVRASSVPARWALGELQAKLDARGVKNRVVATPAEVRAGELAVTATGRDVQGLTYALLDLADQLEHTGTLASSSVAEAPANRIRSVIRPFVSEVEDKAWFYDRDGWRDYLTMLATERFSRFSLTFGIGYDFTREVRDSYFHFPYPFLVKVPGYDVQVPGVSDAERQRNLDMVRFIGEETVRRGIDFQVGIWTHAYNFDDSPNADRKITGLNAQNHAPYCRDALRAVLEACPTITGLTLRTHGESGVPEESYPFWKTVFNGVLATKRTIGLDLHAKGLDWPMIELTQATGMPVTISPKYWAEHMGLPYHQAGIRQLEMPKPRPKGDFFALSSGSRSFLRYGYGDLLKEGRKYQVLYRMWPGTQRLLLWGDPTMAAAYGRTSSFCGTDGVELCEPLSFKGRKGSGLPGGRNGYADASLVPKRDWQKYAYSYRVWGRLLHNPETSPEVWRRQLRSTLGDSAEACEKALAASSRILPLITTAHMPSAANAVYWPEIYTNQSIVIDNGKDPYADTTAPKRFGTVSPIDPRMFAGIDEYADDLLAGRPNAKYNPIEVAAWLEDLARESSLHLKKTKAVEGPEYRRLAADAEIQNGIGLFFAAKVRAGVAWAMYKGTGDPAARAQALAQYRTARTAWQGVVERAAIYRDDLTFGYVPNLRGSWKDRLAAIDQDIVAMDQAPAVALVKSTPDTSYVRAEATVTHTPPPRFRRAEAIPIRLSAPGAVKLHYRHVNQAETWQSLEMAAAGSSYSASIPGDYTDSEYPIQYYFEILLSPAKATMHPGLPRDFSHPPYYTVRSV